ncbi:MAG: hypothetical protein O3B73_11615, partial [bacterium]|nr:hypothetical protein [bacterium]
MSAWRNIWSVARYERKMLVRTTKFRILGGLGLGIPVLIGGALAIAEARGVELPYTGLGTFMPFYIYSFIQTLLIGFIVGDFRAADERANIYEVVAARPISTAELVAGKYMGVVGALVTLSIGVMVLTLVVQATKVSITGDSLSLRPYLGYLLLMNFPGLLYMSALTFFLGAVFRRQSAVALLVIAYALGVLVYLGPRYGGLYDFGAFYAPLYYSDLLGLGDINRVVVIRVFYLLLAVGFFGLSIDRYPRLPQSVAWRWFGRSLAILGLTGAGLTYWQLESSEEMGRTGRAQLLALQESYADRKIALVTNYGLSIRLNEADPLAVTGEIELLNANSESLETIILSLNPGLKVQSLTVDSAEVAWSREATLIIIKLHSPLGAQETMRIQLAYAGDIDTDAFDLERELGEPRLRKRDGPINKGSMTAWITDSSVFLPSRSRWYPVTGVDYGNESGRPQSFSLATLVFNFARGLEIITQGTPVKTDSLGSRIAQRWVSEKPIPELSLNAGLYQKIEARIHNIDCAMYFHAAHRKQVDFFEDVRDEVIESLGQILDAMEQESGLHYPYARLSLVEVPFHVQWYYEGWEETGGLTFPGVLLVEEDTVTRQRFRREYSLQEARSRGNRDPNQIKRDLFVRAVMSTFFVSEGGRGSTETGVFRSPVVQLWSFNKSFSGDHYALVKQGMPMFLQENLGTSLRSSLFASSARGGRSRGGFQRPTSGGSRAGWDTLVAKMQRRSFSELVPKQESKLYRQVVEAKGPAMFKMLKAYMGDSNFLGLVEEIDRDYAYEDIDFASFERAAIGDSTDPDANKNLKKLMRDWLYSTDVPGYTLTRVIANKVDDGFGLIVYQVLVRIRNGEPGRGFVQITAMGRGDEAVKGVEIEGGQEVEVGMVMWEQPFRVSVEPFFARNRRPIVSPVRVPDQVTTGFPESYVREVTDSDESFVEIIVDNDDEGFDMPIRRERKYLRPELKGGNWTERVLPMAYGRYETNYRFKRAGDGAQPAIWTTIVPKTGEYDVAYYFLDPEMAKRIRIGSYFSLLVSHGARIDTLRFERSQMKAGWNVLGRFNFEKGETARVELPDLSSGMLYADAVRWRFIDPDRPAIFYEDEAPAWGSGGRGGPPGG